MSNKTYVKATCHCGRNAFQTTFITAKLPQAGGMCHCDNCRHTTGKLAVHGGALAGPPLAVDCGPDTEQTPGDLSTLVGYKTSPPIVRYFCPGCGAYMFIAYTPPAGEGGEVIWMVMSGALERVEGILKVGYHMFLTETGDGGLAEHYQVLDGKPIPRYELFEGGATVPLGWKSDKLKEAQKASAPAGVEERLPAYCHCKAIQVHLTRASPEEVADPTKWWLVKSANDADPRVRFMGGQDFCGSCRRTSGALITSWTILPRVNVVDDRTSLPIAFTDSGDKRIPGLTRYESSPGTFREFCGTCGAAAFFWRLGRDTRGEREQEKEGEEPRIIDIGAGLFNQDVDGARAESWCSWHHKVVHGGDALDVAGRDAVQECLAKLAGAVKA